MKPNLHLDQFEKKEPLPEVCCGTCNYSRSVNNEVCECRNGPPTVTLIPAKGLIGGQVSFRNVIAFPGMRNADPGCGCHSNFKGFKKDED